MKNIFEQGEFNSYRVVRLDESRSAVTKSYQFSLTTTIFISHKHDDLEDLKGIIGFLEKEYNVKAFIDSNDPSMPLKTSGETAKQIKDKIVLYDKFILLATNGAVESKWCNWELGFGDAQKFNKDNIALFPIKPKGECDSAYKGTEYMLIYPYIVYRDGSEKYSSGDIISCGYYVRTENKDGPATITPLSDWLKQK